MYIVFMERQFRSVSDMLDRSAGASELVCDILQPSNQVVAKFWPSLLKLSRIIDFRNYESVREIHIAIQSSLGALQTIASQSLQENEILSRVAQQGRFDSKILKVLTVITTVYLPASLIAVRCPSIFMLSYFRY